MGGLVSNLRSKGKSDETEEIKKYEEKYENSPYGYAFADDEALKKVKWWQYLLYDMRFRIGYALLIGMLLGIVIPVIIYVTWYDKDDSTIYGSCMIKEEARFQCLINGKEPATREACIDALCCWNSSTTTQYNCHYTFPSAFQYTVSQEQSDPEVGTVVLNAAPNHPERMNSLRLEMNWVEGDEEHLNIQIFNPSNPGRTSTYNDNMRQFSGGTKETSKGSLTLSYGDEKGYLFIRVGRVDTQETLIDTRLGPLNSGRDFISFTTTLPTPYFYGLKGGEGIDSKGSVTYGVVNGFENAEVPFYMSLEESGSWHGVLLETKLPFVTQVLPAPAIMFHVQGTLADINLHVFPGPSPSEVFRQFHKYVNETINSSKPAGQAVRNLPYIPPYWGYGLHLCRKSDNASVILEHLKELNELHSDGGTNRNSSRIIYDSDCIDEDLRSPFSIDQEKFPEATTDEGIDIRDIFDYLQNSTVNKKILLTQKLSIPWNASQWNTSLIREMLVYNKTGSSSAPFVGHIGELNVVYPDVFHPQTFKDFSAWGIDLENMTFDGIIMTDNFPRNDKALETCGKYESFLDRFLSNGTTYTDPDGNLTWGSVCPNMLHTLYDSESDSSTEVLHADVHNVYGQEALNIFLERVIEVIVDEGSINNMVISSSSMWTEGLYYGGRNGMEVAFSWIGLRESLAHYLENFITSPFSGTPICGSFLLNDSRVFEPDLCLRWYQVGLLLPFAYHSYGHANSSRGPLDLPDGYQRYLNEAVRQRYTYAPYYYTLAVDYQESLIPPITPMSFFPVNYNVTSSCSNDKRVLFNIVDQFMIGEGLLASPIVKPVLNRVTYFPPGVWYDVDGFVAWDNAFCGGSKIVTGHIHQTPMFIRGGHIIPTIQNPGGNTILESRQGDNNYTLLVALLTNGESHGKLLNYESGFDEPDSLTFEAKMETLAEDVIQLLVTIKPEIHSPDCGSTSTTKINHLKLLGFPTEYNNVTIEGYPAAQPFPGDDVNTLRIDDLNIDWCRVNTSEVVKISAHKSQTL